MLLETDIFGSDDHLNICLDKIEFDKIEISIIDFCRIDYIYVKMS